MKKLCTKRIYLFLYSIVLFPNIYFTISQGTPYYPVKGKNDYPISNREEYRVVALLLFFCHFCPGHTQDSDSDKMRRKISNDIRKAVKIHGILQLYI